MLILCNIFRKTLARNSSTLFENVAKCEKEVNIDITFDTRFLCCQSAQKLALHNAIGTS